MGELAGATALSLTRCNATDLLLKNVTDLGGDLTIQDFALLSEDSEFVVDLEDFQSSGSISVSDVYVDAQQRGPDMLTTPASAQIVAPPSSSPTSSGSNATTPALLQPSRQTPS